MMRYTTGLSAVLGVALVMPAIGMDARRIKALEGTLDETQQALRILGDLQRRLEVEPRGVSQVVLSVTEEPILDGARRDERLVGLRNEVDLLQMELDALRNGTEFNGVLGTPPPTSISGTHEKSAQP